MFVILTGMPLVFRGQTLDLLEVPQSLRQFLNKNSKSATNNPRKHWGVSPSVGTSSALDTEATNASQATIEWEILSYEHT